MIVFISLFCFQVMSPPLSFTNVPVMVQVKCNIKSTIITGFCTVTCANDGPGSALLAVPRGSFSKFLLKDKLYLK